MTHDEENPFPRAANALSLGPEPRVPGMDRVTKWLAPLDPIPCRYGILEVREWLATEKVRIEQDPRRLAQVVRHEGWIALYAN